MENYSNFNNQGHHPSSRLIIGLVLVMAGFFLLLRNTNIFPGFIEDIIFSWQMLLIVIGLIITLGGSNKTPGIVLMAVGGFFMIPTLFHDIFGTYRVFWPALFITAGVLIIFTGRTVTGKLFRHNSEASGDDFIDVLNIFSGGDRQVHSENFNGGKITSIFGGSKIDLTKCKLAPGVSQLDISCVFGGTEIIVPEEWSIVLDVVPVLGGFSDERKISSGRIFDTTRQLIIKGTVVFGGGELKCY
jgi:predicted membrane protein